MKGFYLRIAVFLMGLSLYCIGAFQGNVKASSVSNEFIKGMDLSSLEAVEDSGAVFYDENGVPIPNILEYLAQEKQVNYVRLRVWNNPTLSFDAGDYCNKEHTVEMAQRVKAAGMKLLIDFHYSDFWADPAHQTKPEAWKNLSFPQLVTAVYDYTEEVLEALKQVGAYPDMVQIGNEISGGLLWDDGYIDNMSNLAALLNSGISAVRDTTPTNHNVKIMLHLAEGGDVERFEYFFDSIEAHGVTDYDVIGMSYYAYWHGPLSNVKANMNNVVQRYNKEVVIVETSYPYTYADADTMPNAIGTADTDIAALPATVGNQKLMLEMTFNTVATVNSNKGLGVFYWEPLWLAVEGVGVAQGQGNEWDNQILFDHNHKALDSLNGFLFQPSAAAVNNNKHTIVYSPKSIKVQVDTYNSLTEVLPQTVKVLKFDGTLDYLPVTWTGASGINMNQAASYELTGVVSGLNPYSGAVLAAPKIKVTLQRNLVSNPSFETTGTNTNWSIHKIYGNAGQITDGVDSTPYSGEGSFHYWDSSDFCVEVSQIVDVAPNHTYTLSAFAQGSWANIDYNDTHIFIKYIDNQGNVGFLGKTELLNANYGWWNEFKVEGIVIPSNVERILIGARITGLAGGYGTLDDFELLDHDANAPVITRNRITNPGFEAEEGSGSSAYPSMNGWSVIANNNNWPATSWANATQNRTQGGKYAFNYYHDNTFYIEIKQAITNLPNGTYRLSVWSYGSNDGKNAKLYAYNGNTTVEAGIYDTNAWSGGPVWNEFVLENIVVENGTLEIGAYVNGLNGSWGYFDDLSLVRVN